MAEKTTMPEQTYVHVGRLLCTVLDEMRDLHKYHNYACLSSHIEEIQMLANRMESALEEQKNVVKLHEDIHNLKVARKALVAEVEAAIKERDDAKARR